MSDCLCCYFEWECFLKTVIVRANVRLSVLLFRMGMFILWKRSMANESYGLQFPLKTSNRIWRVLKTLILNCGRRNLFLFNNNRSSCCNYFCLYNFWFGNYKIFRSCKNYFAIKPKFRNLFNAYLGITKRYILHQTLRFFSKSFLLNTQSFSTNYIILPYHQLDLPPFTNIRHHWFATIQYI